MFLMAPTEDRQANGIITAGHIAEINNLLGFILRLSVNPSSNVYDTTIFSKTLSTPPPLIVDNLVTTQITNATLGSQRGRQLV